MYASWAAALEGDIQQCKDGLLFTMSIALLITAYSNVPFFANLLAQKSVLNI